MKKFIVYEHLFPNGKRYFGITSKMPNARWEGGTGYNKEHQPVMYNAIRKYGWDNIQHIVLFEGSSFDEACSKEKELIARYRTNCCRYGNDYGYNMTDGGEGRLGGHHSEESKEKSRQRLFGKKGKDCPNSRPVICDGVEYESLTQFKEMNGNPRGNINGWLNGKVAMPMEWYVKGLCYKDLGAEVTFPQNFPHSYQLEYNGQIYGSQKELATELGVSPAMLTKWLNGKSYPPKEVVDKGLHRVGEEKISKYCSKRLKTKVYYDGKVYESQKELAEFLQVERPTLNCWLTGKNKMPQKYKDKGLSYIE